MRKLACLVSSASISLALFYGCVGDSPTSPTADAATGGDSAIDTAPPRDSSAGDSAVPGDSEAKDSSSPDVPTGDGRVPTCYGQPFGAPTSVDMSQVSAALGGVVWGPRVVGANAYFAAVPNGGNEQQLFRATFAPGAGGAAPGLSNAVQLSPPSLATVVEWAPTVARDSTMMVFNTGLPQLAQARELALSLATGGAFAAGVAIGNLNTTFDEADPWLVGRPQARALYFSRDDAAKVVALYRAPVTGVGTFGAAARVSLTCPLSNCGTPVVAPNEDLILFGAWPAGGFAPTVREASLGVAGATASATNLVDHPELGAHYPSWLSDDGCEVLLGGGGISQITDIAYARRTPK